MAMVNAMAEKTECYC